MLRTHTCGELTKKDADEKVTLAGWVDSIRISGKVGFLDLRDRYGQTQIFLKAELAKEFRNLNREDILQVTGEVKVRPASQVKGQGTGEIEVKAKNIKILQEVPPLPLDLDESIQSTEETRLKYRYIDLRRPEMQESIILRHRLIKAIRDFLDQENFLEIETPILAKSTPEGARDYLVPSRNNPGQFFALPQSPQIFKQLLMVSGFDKYFQIARCFRDEDLRADRQPEFTQLDIEMSFIEEEDIYNIMERMLKFVWEKVLDKEIKIPFSRMSYTEVMRKHNTDKPNLSKKNEEFNFLWVNQFPLFEFSKEENRYLSMHHPFTAPNQDDIKFLHTKKDQVSSRSYDLVLNGFEIAGGSIRISDENLQKEVFQALGISDKEARDKFGFLLDALKFAPPHGGIAFGLDRLAMIMAGKKSIRDVIAFPKNKDARDLMADAPSEVSKGQLKEVHIKLNQK